MNIIILFILLFVCVSLSIPVGVSLGISTAITIATTSNLNLNIIAQTATTCMDSFSLMAIPFYILAGNLMSIGGISKRIVNFCDLVVGRLTGGLGMATITASMFFAAISGSSPATVSAMGTIMIPEMEERGYSEEFATGLTTVAGTIGVIIPPSIPFVIYGVVSGASVGKLFFAGIIPGLLIGAALMVVCYIISKKRGYRGISKNKANFGRVFLDSIWALLSPVIILGGIYAGIFTPTEAAVVGIVYSFIIGAFVYKEIDPKNLKEIFAGACNLNGMNCLAIGLSMGFANYLAMMQIPNKLASLILSTFNSEVVILLCILLILLVAGCFVDNISSTLILTPVFLPIVTSFGIDPVHFGVIMTVTLAIGFCTPPYGANLFIATAITNISIMRIAKAAIPFIIALFVCLMLITFIPGISMGLVQLLA